MRWVVFQAPDTSLLVTIQIGLSGWAGKSGEQPLMLKNTEIEDSEDRSTWQYLFLLCLTFKLDPSPPFSHLGKSCSRVNSGKVSSTVVPNWCPPQRNHNIYMPLGQMCCQRVAEKVVNLKVIFQHIAWVWFISRLTDVDKQKKKIKSQWK